MIRLSIVVPILDSHEVVRRQVCHYQKIGLPPEVELILVDDGSDPPLPFDSYKLPNLTGLRTNNKKPWSEHAARNVGAKAAKGEYLFLIDVDYIIPWWTVEQVLRFRGDRMGIKRRFGVLDEYGDLRRDRETLLRYGLRRKWSHCLYFPGHRSQFVIRRDLFWRLKGYREDLAGQAHPDGGGAGCRFNAQWRLLKSRGLASEAEEKAEVFMFPNGKYATSEDPLHLFHNLPRKERVVCDASTA